MVQGHIQLGVQVAALAIARRVVHHHLANTIHLAAIHPTAHLAPLVVSTLLGVGAPPPGAVHGAAAVTLASTGQGVGASPAGAVPVALVAPLVSTGRGVGAPQQEAAQGAVMALPTPTTLEAVAPATLVPGHATLDTQ